MLDKDTDYWEQNNKKVNFCNFSISLPPISPCSKLNGRAEVENKIMLPMTGIRLAEVPEEGRLTPPPVANNLSSVSSVRSDTIHTSQLKICIIRQHSNGVFGPDKKN